MKPRLLLVAPYGIALRDCLLNDRFSSYLRSNFTIDVYTELRFSNPEEWGIDEVISLVPDSATSRMMNRFNQRALSMRFRMDFKRFHDVVEAPEMYSIWLGAVARSPTRDPRFETWNRIGKSLPGKLLHRVLDMMPNGRGGIGGALRKGRYDLVLLTHPTEGICTGVGVQAVKAGIPTACLVMGMDNLQGGPILMDPDLFLLWGADQAEWLHERHARFRPSLGNSNAAKIGSLSHDNIVLTVDPELFDQTYPHIGPESTVITFATYTRRGDPGQVDACETILEFFDESIPNGHLVVRVRPGLEEDYWYAFAAEHPGRVTVQIPQGSFYSKWKRDIEIDRSIEEADVALYGETLRRSSVVVTSTFSTVYVDAYAAGTPAIAVGILPEDGDPYVRDTYAMYARVLPYMGQIGLVTEKEELSDLLAAVLLEGRSGELLDRVGNIYAATAGMTDGKAGERAATALDSLKD